MRSHCIRPQCPACGPFGLGAWNRARRARKTAQRLADAEHVAWARALAVDSRRRRADADGLIAVTDCRAYPVKLPPGRYERVVQLPAMTLHTHTAEQECRGALTGCTEYAASRTTEVTDILPELTPEQEASARRLSEQLQRGQAIVDRWWSE